ncbi:LysR family transcriptional regulator [Sneathiella sp.]|uniref:LysR family transcriptional regulator n=1 Tax=Sneathiella sp. TaxID=1964365 RepID=UPI00356575F7
MEARHLSFRHMEMFVAIDRCDTMGDAARTLLITPSALTHRIREAERRLGVVLFEKRGRIARPTAAALILTHTAERVMKDLYQSERVAIASSEGIQHVLRISVAVYNAFHWLPDFLLWFRVANPQIGIEIETQGAIAPFDLLSKGSIDLVMSPDIVLPGQLESMDLFDDELVAVMPPSHALGQKSYLTGRDFVNDPFLTYSLVRQLGYEADRIWTPENVMPPREDNIGSVDAICELIKAGFGISILSHWAIYPQFLSGNLRPVRATQNGLDITWRAIIKSAASKGAPERILMNALADWFRLNPPSCLTH